MGIPIICAEKSEAVQVQRFRIALKDRVIDETAPIAEIDVKKRSKAHFWLEALACISMIRGVRKSVFWHASYISDKSPVEQAFNRASRKFTHAVLSATAFVISDSYWSTTAAEKCLVCDALICCYSLTQLESLFNSAAVLLDETFSEKPPFFDQLYTVHALKFECSTM